MVIFEVNNVISEKIFENSKKIKALIRKYLKYILKKIYLFFKKNL